MEWTDRELTARLDWALCAPLALSVVRVLDLVGELVVPDLGEDARTLQVMLERLLVEALQGTGASVADAGSRGRSRSRSRVTKGR